MDIGSGWMLVQQIALALFIFGLGWFFSGWAATAVRTLVDRRNLDQALGRFLASLARWTIVAVAGIASLGTVGIETTSMAALFASAGIAVGLALQGSLSNFAAGVMILVFRPFTIGDVIQAAGATGTCEEIGLFATTLITPANETVIIPNSAITSATITNFTRRGTRRASIDVGVAYGSDVKQVVEALTAAAKTSEKVLEEPAPAVIFVGLGASSLDFRLNVWANNADFFPMQNEVRTAVYEGLGDAGIEIPFNQIVVHQASAAEAVAAK